jgi:hypothetical protein
MTQESVEPTPNPYNMRKEWHTPDIPSHGDANGLFYSTKESQATSNETVEAPVETKRARTNYKKRYDDLKKHYDAKLADFKQKEQELLAKANSNRASYKPPKSIEDLEQFKTENPDLYATVESVAHLQTQQQMEAVQQKLSTLEERERMLSRKEAETSLAQRHPDFEDIKGDENFHTWAKMQQEQIQQWVYQNPDNVELAAKAIDLYKLETGILTSQKSKSQPRGNAADFVSTKTTSIDTKEPRIWSKQEIAKMSMREFDKYEAEIDQAIMEGRVRP